MSARERLRALHPARHGPAVEATAADDPIEPVAPEPEPPPRAAPGARRVGRLVRRWIPETVQSARWDPGRPGALALTVVAALAAVLAAAGVWLDRPSPQPVAPLPTLAAAPVSAVPDPPDELVVSVVGKVADPGLVRLPAGSRVADALEAAGGKLPGSEFLGLNLARKLSDGEQLLVGIAPPPGSPAGAGQVRLINLNTATQDQLETLPGIGPVTAQSILDWRAEHGSFTSVDQLLQVSGIGDATLAKLEDLVTV